MNSAFRMVARSVGYRIGKRRGKGWVKNKEVDFTELFKEPYASEAAVGFSEGMEFIKNGGLKDTFQKSRKSVPLV